ncbi:MAG: CHAT domain-containing protein [Agriterribacter sp.]
MKRCGLEKDSAFMYALQKIGVLYSRQADFIKAVEYTNRSISIAKKCLQNKRCTTLPIVEGYYNLFYYYEMSGQDEEKYQAIDSSVIYALKEGLGLEMIVPGLEAEVDYFFNKGEYDECIKRATLAEQILKDHYTTGDSATRAAYFAYFKAGAMYYSGNNAKAEAYISQSKIRLETNGHLRYLAVIYELLGVINRDNKKYIAAIGYFKKGLNVASDIKDNFYSADMLLQIGMTYGRNFSQYNKGLKICELALKYRNEADSLSIYREMGNIYALQHLYAKAQNCFQKAYNSFEAGFDETKMLQRFIAFPSFNLLQNLFDLTNDKGTAYLQEYYFTKDSASLKKALAIYRIADLFLAKIKADQHLQLKSNLVWRNTARSLYEHAIEACYAGNNMEDAFYFFEKSRAVLLNDQIDEQRWMTNSDIAALAQSKKEILELERKLNETPSSSPEYFAAQRDLLDQNKKQEILIQQIKQKNPVFYENYVDSSFLTLQQLRKDILGSEKSLLEIFSGDSAVYALFINAKTHQLIKIDKTAYDSVSRAYIYFISHRNDLNRNFAAFIKKSSGLYQLLFQNISPPDGSIIISPDGTSYPFEALVVKGSAAQPDYFVNHCATSYTYSAKYLTNHFVNASASENNFLGIAPVKYKPDTQLAELSGSDLSLKRIEGYYNNVTAFVFANATKNNFMQHFPDYSIIQLYTHASDSSANNDPVIYFADSALYLSDLISEKKPVTQLVILSACETAKGQMYRGEGIFSFNRGFASLGIPAAISNLWSVDEQSTYKITELFYKYLSTGLTTDIALQRAKKNS